MIIADSKFQRRRRQIDACRPSRRPGCINRGHRRHPWPIATVSNPVPNGFVEAVAGNQNRPPRQSRCYPRRTADSRQGLRLSDRRWPRQPKPKPGRGAVATRRILAIVPCKASMLEVRALAKATDVLRQIAGYPQKGPARKRSSYSAWSAEITD